MTTLADANTTPSGIAINPSLGRQSAATTRSVNLSNEDYAAIQQLATLLSGTLTVTANVGTGTQPVSGTITANAGTGTMAVSLASLPALATGANVIGGVTQSGTWNVAVSNASLAITAASLPLPTGAAADATLTGGSQRTKLTDGTNNAAVKAASTAPVATDPALVVAISPNSSLTASGNTTQLGGAAINLGAGTVGTGTQRITQASDSPLVVATGAVGDSAWASGNGSVIALLKTLATAALSTASSAVTIDQTTPGTTDAVTVKSPADVISFTPTLDTAAYAAGDVLFATAAIAGITRANDLRSALMSLTAIDKSKNKPAFTLFFYQTNVTSAAANAANALSDADAVNCLGFVRVASTDWIDLANNSFACLKGINLLLEAATGTTTVYALGILDAGTPTFAVGDLVLKLGVVQS